MKSMVSITTLALGLAMGSSIRAQAMNREWAAAAGFVGGVLVADAHHDHHGYYESRAREIQPVYVQTYCTQPETVVVTTPPTGHYELQQRQIWVAGAWTLREVGPNTFQKVWTPGYYQTETVRVWVPGEAVCSTVDP